MSSSFTDGITAVVPVLVAGYDAARQSQHVYHSILGLAGGEDVYARAATPRTGTFTVVFDNLADAQTLSDLCTGTKVITFADSDVPSIGMRFMADGEVRMTLDEETGVVWLVTIDFHEVTP